jgi:hypothetical protein
LREERKGREGAGQKLGGGTWERKGWKKGKRETGRG